VPIKSRKPAKAVRKVPPWLKPSEGRVALSVDGSFDREGLASMDMVLRDAQGIMIFAACRRNYNDVLEWEVSAILEGLALAHTWSAQPLILQTDCAVALHALRCSERNRTVHGTCWIERDQNRVAHCLANLSRSGLTINCWVR
jgi:ribonuclease HI